MLSLPPVIPHDVPSQTSSGLLSKLLTLVDRTSGRTSITALFQTQTIHHIQATTVPIRNTTTMPTAEAQPIRSPHIAPH